jgi:hypothetical protein
MFAWGAALSGGGGEHDRNYIVTGSLGDVACGNGTTHARRLRLVRAELPRTPMKT